MLCWRSISSLQSFLQVLSGLPPSKSCLNSWSSIVQYSGIYLLQIWNQNSKDCNRKIFSLCGHLCVLRASGLPSLPSYRSFLHLICPTCSFYHRSWVVLPPVVWPCPSCCAEPRDPRQTDLILSPAGRGRAENLYSYQLACLLRNHSQVSGPRFINKPFLLPLFFYVCSIT